MKLWKSLLQFYKTASNTQMSFGDLAKGNVNAWHEKMPAAKPEPQVPEATTKTGTSNR
jgi:hypothetical protein